MGYGLDVSLVLLCPGQRLTPPGAKPCCCFILLLERSDLCLNSEPFSLSEPLV